MTDHGDIMSFLCQTQHNRLEKVEVADTGMREQTENAQTIACWWQVEHLQGTEYCQEQSFHCDSTCNHFYFIIFESARLIENKYYD